MKISLVSVSIHCMYLYLRFTDISVCSVIADSLLTSAGWEGCF